MIVGLASRSEDKPKKKVSGYFKLSQIQSPTSRNAARVNTTEETAFDLDTIKATREYWNLLSRVTVDVKTMDITICSDEEEIDYNAFDGQASRLEC